MSTRPWSAAATGWSRLPRDARDALFLVAVSAWTIAPHLAHRPAWFGLGVAALLAWRVHLTLARRPLPGRWTVVGLLVLSAAATAWHEGTLLGREAGVSLLVVLMALKTLELRARRDAVVLFFLGFFVVLTHFFDAQGLGTALAMAVAVRGLLTALVLAHMPVGRPPLRQAAAVPRDCELRKFVSTTKKPRKNSTIASRRARSSSVFSASSTTSIDTPASRPMSVPSCQAVAAAASPSSATTVQRPGRGLPVRVRCTRQASTAATPMPNHAGRRSRCGATVQAATATRNSVSRLSRGKRRQALPAAPNDRTPT